MATVLPKTRPYATEIELGSAGVFEEVILPENRSDALISVYATAEAYFCYTGEDGGTRSGEARVPIPSTRWIELDRETAASLFFASAEGGGTLHLKLADFR